MQYISVYTLWIGIEYICNIGMYVEFIYANYK